MGCTFSTRPGSGAGGGALVVASKDGLELTVAQQREEPAEPLLSRLPPELQLLVLAHLDADALCAAAHACGSLAELAADASLWRRLSLTLCSRPWPPRPPAALRSLRVCSYRWPSARHARRALSWLQAGLRAVRRLELVGRNLDADTLRACVDLCADSARELSLHDVCVQDAWMGQLARMTRLEVLHLDWHTEMSCQQMLQLAAACPALRLIDTAGCPRDCTAGPARCAVQDALRTLKAGLELS